MNTIRSCGLLSLGFTVALVTTGCQATHASLGHDLDGSSGAPSEAQTGAAVAGKETGSMDDRGTGGKEASGTDAESAGASATDTAEDGPDSAAAAGASQTEPTESSTGGQPSTTTEPNSVNTTLVGALAGTMEVLDTPPVSERDLSGVSFTTAPTLGTLVGGSIDEQGDVTTVEKSPKRVAHEFGPGEPLLARVETNRVFYLCTCGWQDGQLSPGCLELVVGSTITARFADAETGKITTFDQGRLDLSLGPVPMTSEGVQVVVGTFSFAKCSDDGDCLYVEGGKISVGAGPFNGL